MYYVPMKRTCFGAGFIMGPSRAQMRHIGKVPASFLIAEGLEADDTVFGRTSGAARLCLDPHADDTENFEGTFIGASSRSPSGLH